MAKGQCFTVKQLKINGGDLKNIGIKPGPKMGEIISALLDEVIEDPEKNTEEYLLKRAGQLAENTEN